MKMQPVHLAALSESISATVARHPDAADGYRANGATHMRYRWDVLHASRHDTAPLYRYLTDAHIDTALRQILGADWR